ncbi:MAG: aminopeptidase [Firmicutes bacterium]|nr:aminopeptidase [Bacillota bacterium]
MSNAWLKYDEKETQACMDFNKDYMAFISKCKTERVCVKESIRIAQEAGYKDFKEMMEKGESLKPQDKIYYNMMNKSLVLMHVGSDPLEKGMNLLGAHVDSPRMDLKQHPLYEKDGLAYLDTHYYGGIKKYQWVTIPLALYGVVCKKDGSVVDICIGDEEDDPVFVVSDLLIHLASKQMQQTASEVVTGENLNVTFGSIPVKDEEKEPVKKNILALLKKKYDIEEDDFLSAEIEVVPAGKARNCGLDESMILGYGHDDRICAYPSLMAQLEMKEVARTCVTLLVDKEEIGSVGATGMHSRFFENFIAEVFNALGDYSEIKVRRAFQNSHMLSSDVCAAHDPNYPEVTSDRNMGAFGEGLAICKYTGSRGKSGCNDASAEFLAKLRKIFDGNDVSWQTSELGKVDAGGGGTIAYIMGNYGMNVVDAGVPVHNMHAPNELCSKADIYEAYKGYIAFLKECK